MYVHTPQYIHVCLCTCVCVCIYNVSDHYPTSYLRLLRSEPALECCVDSVCVCVCVCVQCVCVFVALRVQSYCSIHSS